MSLSIGFVTDLHFGPAGYHDGKLRKLSGSGTTLFNVKLFNLNLPARPVAFGFDTAINIAMEAIDRLHTTADSHHRVLIVEVMGRHAGWIAAAGGLVEDHGIPVVVLFPEIEFDQAKFLKRVDQHVKKHGFCTVVVSEGCHHPDGTFLAEWGDFYHPMQIWIDDRNLVFVTDQIPRISLLTLDGKLVGRCRGAINGAHGLSGDAQGNLYLSELPPQEITKLEWLH